MARSLLQLPPELLAQILTSLAVKDLLRFGEASHRARRLVVANFHNLTFSFHSKRRPSTRSRAMAIYDKQYPPQTNPVNEEVDPHKIVVKLDPAYDFAILLNLHCALTESLLRRYSALRKLDISLWTLTVPMAKAIACLPALCNLSIRIDKTAFVPRSYKGIEGIEQRRSWDSLAQNAIWAPSVRYLRLENSDINSVQLIKLLRTTCRLRKFCLSSCSFVDEKLLRFMGGRWCGRRTLQALTFEECDAALEGEALDAIEKLSGLQYLDLSNCSGIDRDTIVTRNRDVWHIKEVVLSEEISCERIGIIEVDPAYMFEGEVLEVGG